MITPQPLSVPASSSPSSVQSGAALFSGNQGDPAPRRRINPWRRFLGAFVPNWLLLRPEVSPGAKLCYARLAQYAGQNNDCHPRQETLAAELAVSARTANDYLRELRRHALLEWDRHGLGKANRYFFLDHPWIYEGPPLRAASGPTSQDSSGQELQTSAAPIEEENQTRESKERGTQTTASRERFLPSSEDEAAKSAALNGVPADFAQAVFNHMEGVGWVDGSKRVIRKWGPYIKSRWAGNNQSAPNARPVLPASTAQRLRLHPLKPSARTASPTPSANSDSLP